MTIAAAEKLRQRRRTSSSLKFRSQVAGAITNAKKIRMGYREMAHVLRQLADELERTDPDNPWKVVDGKAM